MTFLVGSLAGGNVVSTCLNMVGGILVARLVAPATLGLFNGIGLVLRYAPLLQLGITTGLYRELPYYIGKGEPNRARAIAATAQGWALVVGGLVSAVLFGIGGWQFLRGEHWLAAAWSTQAILAVFLFYKTSYLLATYRTSHEFARVALVGVVESSATFALIVLVAVLGFYGLCLRAAVAGAIGTALLHYWRPVRVRPRLNLGDMKRLLFVGAPILAAGQLYQLWTVINSTLVFRLAGAEGMGLYSLVGMAGSALGILPLAVAQVLFPRMTEQFGRTGSVRGSLRVAVKPVMITTIGLIPIVLMAQWMVEPAIRLVVPRYVDAVPAVRWGLVLPLLTNLQAVNAIFTIVKRQRLFAAATVTGMASYCASLMWLIRDEVTLVAFPQAMLVGRAVFIIVCYCFVVFLARSTDLASRFPEDSQC